jgi:hypothetical protein
MDALEIISKVQANYGACSSYRDIGFVASTAEDGRHHDVNFATYFVRPDWLRFDWKRAFPGSTASESVRHWFTIRCNARWPSARYLRVRDCGNQKKVVSDAVLNLPGAVAMGSATSHGVVAWIYQLLFPAGGSTQTSLFTGASEVLPQTTASDSADCYVLRGSSLSGDLELWVDRERFAICRALFRAGQTVHDVSVHACAFNESIDTQMFD